MKTGFWADFGANYLALIHLVQHSAPHWKAVFHERFPFHPAQNLDSPTDGPAAGIPVDHRSDCVTRVKQQKSNSFLMFILHIFMLLKSIAHPLEQKAWKDRSFSEKENGFFKKEALDLGADHTKDKGDFVIPIEDSEDYG